MDDDGKYDTHGTHRSDRGFTLIEAVLVVGLTSLVVVGILAGVRTLIISSSVAYDGAQLQTVLLNASDRVERAEQRCSYEQYVDAAALANGWPTSTTTVTVERLVANTGDPATDWATETCSPAVRPFDVQRLVISATTPDGRITRTLTVVKSDVE